MTRRCEAIGAGMDASQPHPLLAELLLIVIETR